MTARDLSVTDFDHEDARLRVFSQLYVDRPPLTVWKIFDDLEKWAEWSPICNDCRFDRGDALIEGTVLAMRLHFRFFETDVRCELSRVTPGRHIRWETRRLGVRITHTYTLVPRASGTVVSNEEVFLGLRSPFRGLVRTWFRRTDLSLQSLKGIKRLVEAER